MLFVKSIQFNSAANYFRKMVDLRCLAGFLMHLWNITLYEQTELKEQTTYVPHSTSKLTKIGWKSERKLSELAVFAKGIA